jgi:hypothetical protein
MQQKLHLRRILKYSQDLIKNKNFALINYMERLNQLSIKFKRLYGGDYAKYVQRFEAQCQTAAFSKLWKDHEVAWCCYEALWELEKIQSVHGLDTCPAVGPEIINKVVTAYEQSKGKFNFIIYSRDTTISGRAEFHIILNGVTEETIIL